MRHVSTKYAVQIQTGEGWADEALFDTRDEAMTFFDSLVEHADPGQFDRKLRVIERVTTERTVAIVNRTVIIPASTFEEGEG